MADKEIYTITIVRNIGIPISLTVKRSKAVFLMVVFIVFLSILSYASISYLLLYANTKSLNQELERSQKEVLVLSEQIAKLDHDRYWGSETSKSEEFSQVKSAILNQPDFSTEGIWVTEKSTFSEEDFLEGTSAEIEGFDASVKGDDLNIRLKLLNTSNPIQNLGGYICITLKNGDHSPPLFKSLSKGAIGENGYPASYKTGQQYLIKRRSSTKHFKFTLTEVNEYYTEAIVFLYSYKGRLLGKQVIELKKDIFLE
ncbi:MAG: hypothetical protein ABIK68_21875 [bacterium]